MLPRKSSGLRSSENPDAAAGAKHRAQQSTELIHGTTYTTLTVATQCHSYTAD